MTERTLLEFGACLKPALAYLADSDSRLAELRNLLWQVPVERLVQCITTPRGRDFLRTGISTPEGSAWLGIEQDEREEASPEILVAGRDILRWAFAAELMQLGIPAGQALSLVDQGITLRDVRFKPSKELAERRWKLATELVMDGVSAARDVAARLDAPELESYLDEHWLKVGDRVLAEGELLERRLEALVKGWLADWFQKLSKQANEAQETLVVDFYDLLVVSDFHLAAGNYPSTDGLARLSPTEDFFFDDAFFRWLYRCEMERLDRDGYPYELVFNGDVLDFAQVVVSGDESNPVKFWAVPPLWLRKTGADLSLPERLLTILKGLFGDGACKDILDRQRGLRETAGLTVTVSYLTEMERAVGSRRRAERGPRGVDGVPGIQEWAARETQAREELEAQWKTLEEEGWEALVEEGALEAQTPSAPEHGPFLGLMRPAVREEVARRRESLEERWEDRAAVAWADLAGMERTARPMHQQRVRRMCRREALGQLADIYFGHRRFFQGLAWFLAQGNRLVVLRGNHDPHWYWPEIQIAFVGWLKTAYDELRRACQNPAGHDLPVRATDLREYLLPEVDLACFESQVDFDHGWYYHREQLAYLEHGGQYDAVNAYRCFLAPVQSVTPPAGGRAPRMEGHASSPPRVSAWLPDLGVGIEEAEFKSSWGNVGMPLVNLLEIELPNFDRPGYKKVYLDWLLYRRPLFLFQKLGQALVETSKAMWEWMATSPGQAVQACHEARRRAYARLTGMSLDCVEKLDETRWVRNWRKPGYVFSVGRRAIAAAAAVLIALVVLVVQFGFLRRGPYAQGQLVIWDYVRSGITSLVLGAISYWGMTLLAGWLNLGEDYLLEPAQRVEGILDEDGHGVPYILFGHDHAHNAQQLPLGGWYLNTGTWMHMYETQRKRLLRAEHEYPFVRMMDTHHVLDQSAHNARPRVELLRWNDKAQRVEPCETFRGADEAGSKERREGTVQTIP